MNAKCLEICGALQLTKKSVVNKLKSQGEKRSTVDREAKGKSELTGLPGGVEFG